MPVYKFKYIDTNGKTVSKKESASSSAEIISRYKGTGRHISEIKEFSKEESIFKKEIVFNKNELVTEFTRELYTLTKAGYPLSEALESISENTGTSTFEFIILDLLDQIKEGSTFNEALKKYPDYFDNIYIQLIKIAEESGNMTEVLENLLQSRITKKKIKTQFLNVMIYPMLMFVFSLVVLSFLLIYIVPKITQIFIKTKQDLPYITKIVISISTFFKDNFIIIIVTVIVAGILIRKYLYDKYLRVFIDKLKFNIPVISKLFFKREMTQIAFGLSTMIKNGVPLLDGLELSVPITKNIVIKRLLRNVIKDVKEGLDITESFIKNEDIFKFKYSFINRKKYYPKFFIKLIRSGKISGNIGDSFTTMNELYQDDVFNLLQRLVNIVEPVILILLGGMVLIIILSIMLPILQMDAMQL